MTIANNIPDVGLRPPAFRCEMRHVESIDMTSPGGKSFSVPGDSVAESDLEIVDDLEILDDDPYHVGRSPSPSSHSEGTSPPPNDGGEDKRRIDMLCAVAESFVPESIPSNTQNLWTPFETPSLKRTFTEAQLDVPETAEEGFLVPDDTMQVPELATLEQPVPSAGQPATSSADQLAIKNLVTDMEEQPATTTVDQPLVVQQVREKPAAESRAMPEQAQPRPEAAATSSSEPPRKRSKLGVAWGAACFLAGSVGTVAALASLPEGYFA